MKNRFITNKNWESEIPIPVDDERPEYFDFYLEAWKLAAKHVLDLPGMPQTPYMDEAFCDTDVWIWDTCFMTLFCKYAPKSFPGIETLNNFYELLYGTKKYPIIITRNAPGWTGETVGKPAQVKLHIADNPPLFAWAEYLYVKMTGDLDHIKELLNKQYLQKHFDWFNSLKEQTSIPGVRAGTCLIRHPLGFFWEGGRSGMDNTPRGRIGEHAFENRPNNPEMLWVDAIGQQALSAWCISQLFAMVGDSEQEREWLARWDELKTLINRYYWDPVDEFYYDIHAKTQSPMRVMTPASFWPVLAGAPTMEQVEKMIRRLNDPNRLGGNPSWVSLARNDADFNAENGEYWRGSVWLPTAYMGLKSLERYDQLDQAHLDAKKILEHMYRTWKDYEPHSIWECYAPNEATPAKSCDESNRVVRSDFCGWSALGPISIYLENVIGLYSADALSNCLKWNLPREIKGKLGVKNYHFGEIETDLVYEAGECRIKSNKEYILYINKKAHNIHPGNNKILL